jgi:hypothetical protein
VPGGRAPEGCAPRLPAAHRWFFACRPGRKSAPLFCSRGLRPLPRGDPPVASAHRWWGSIGIGRPYPWSCDEGGRPMLIINHDAEWSRVRELV